MNSSRQTAGRGLAFTGAALMAIGGLMMFTTLRMSWNLLVRQENSLPVMEQWDFIQQKQAEKDRRIAREWKFNGAMLAICLVAVLSGQQLRRVGKRIALQDAQEARQADARPPILLLRSFAEDRAGYWMDTRSLFAAGSLATTTSTPPSEGRPEGGLELGDVGEVALLNGLLRTVEHAVGPKDHVSFEELLVEAFSVAGPVIAIGRPGEVLPPLGAHRTWVRHDAWQERVTEYLRECGLVVMVMGLIRAEEGLAWELRQVLDRVPPEKIIFVMPPVLEDEAQQRWQSFVARSVGRLPDYEPGALAMGFFRDGRIRVITYTGCYHDLAMKYCEAFTSLLHTAQTQADVNLWTSWARAADGSRKEATLLTFAGQRLFAFQPLTPTEVTIILRRLGAGEHPRAISEEIPDRVKSIAEADIRAVNRSGCFLSVSCKPPGSTLAEETFELEEPIAEALAAVLTARLEQRQQEDLLEGKAAAFLMRDG